jgi:hypothetical protein
MKTRQAMLAAALGLALAGAAAAETIVLAEPEVRTIITRAGYVEPLVIKRDRDLWRVHGVDPAGREVTVFVDTNGELLGAADVTRTRVIETTTTTTTAAPVPRGPISEAEVAAVLIEAGFHNVHDVDRRGDIWKAEADDITGEDFEIHIDARTGMIVHIEDD